ncbi:ankyrin repeat-containing protein [Anaeramoeba flamelloides]|uniref:Ankyrin repeat-containing protein n=1 Tax=Anaeramoeba flamelloides TaxID=1746091 RepID=A0AAV8A1N0_9EUKA|nr:ankyrin repeat-containing protein [Anaeramoeba flamelloides]
MNLEHLFRKEKLDPLKIILKKDFDPKLWENKPNPLHYAAKYHSRDEIFEYLWEIGCEVFVNKVDVFGKTPIIVAAQKNAPKAVFDQLIKHGADIFHCLKNGKSLLEICVSKNVDHEIVELLIQNKVSYTNIDTPILFLACQYEITPQLLELLLKSFPNEINNTNKLGQTPLHIGCINGISQENIKLLVETGLDVKKKTEGGMTALHYACKFNADPSVIEYLIEKGAELNAMNLQRQTPLNLAVNERSSYELVKILLENGADPGLNDEHDQYPIHFCYRSTAQVAELLIKYKSPLEGKNTWGDTPFLKCVKNSCSQEIIKVFLKNGADVNSTGFNKQTCVHRICMEKYPLTVLLDVSKSMGDFNQMDLNDKAPLKYVNINPTDLNQAARSLQNDLKKLLTMNYGHDEIETKDGNMNIVRSLIKCRVPNFDFEQFTTIASQQSKKLVMSLLELIYSGTYTLDLEDVDKFQQLLDDLSIDKQLFLHNPFWKLIYDLEQLMNDQKSKDFKILLNEQHINVHKFILIARSELVYGFDKSMNNLMVEYSENDFSFEEMQIFVHFLYTDELLTEKITKMEMVTNIIKMRDKFLLSKNSSLHLQLTNIQL